MSHITLSEQQSQVIEQAQDMVEIRDHRGNVVVRVDPQFTEADLAEAKRRLASNQPRYPASQVEARLKALGEIVERDGLNHEQAMALLKRMQAEGRP
jgi:hypothetical protein